MSASIGWGEAWGQWFSGRQVESSLYMGPMSVLWWGRAGKIAGFLGGATVVLDLIGPDRLREIGRLPKRHASRLIRLAPVAGFLVGFLAAGAAGFFVGSGFDWLLPVAFMIGAIGLAIVGFEYGPSWVARVLDTEKPAQGLRYVGLALLFVGFHFDLLAS